MLSITSRCVDVDNAYYIDVRAAPNIARNRDRPDSVGRDELSWVAVFFPPFCCVWLASGHACGLKTINIEQGNLKKKLSIDSNRLFTY